MTPSQIVLLLLPAIVVGVVGLIVWASENDTPAKSQQRNEIHREPLYDNKIHWI